VAQGNNYRRRLLRSIEASVGDRGFWLQAGCAARIISYGEADMEGVAGRVRVARGRRYVMRPHEPSKEGMLEKD
jgi:hypothetical protein